MGERGGGREGGRGRERAGATDLLARLSALEHNAQQLHVRLARGTHSLIGLSAPVTHAARQPAALWRVAALEGAPSDEARCLCRLRHHLGLGLGVTAVARRTRLRRPRRLLQHMVVRALQRAHQLHALR